MTHPTGYEALADLIRDQITAGELAPGRRLPTEDTLAQRYGLARDTVRRALTVLRHEGLIEVRHGYGTRVFDRGQVIDVDVPVGSFIESRSPNPTERDRLGIPDGWHLIVVELPAGGELVVPAGHDVVVLREGRVRKLPAHRYRVRAAPT